MEEVKYKRPTRFLKVSIPRKVNYDHIPRTVNRDNQVTYNYGSGGGSNSIRVPSLKRSDRVWRNFYRLFPSLKGRKTYNGCKLKKI